jgi:hypothetical protein
MLKGKVRSLTAGVAALAAAGLAAGFTLAGGGAALAAGGGGATPPWYSQYSAGQGPVGGITFYNAQGQVVTGGDITASGLGAYAIADSADPLAPHLKATLFIATPVNGQNPLTWTSSALSGSTSYPNAAAPAPIGTTTNPVESNNGTDQSIQSAINFAPNTDTSTTDGYGVISVHVIWATTKNPGGTGGTWAVDYPDFTQNTTTTLTATPPTETTSAPITLTATVAPATAGTVSFFSGTTQVGTTKTVTGTNGVATVTTTPPNGTTAYKAFFTPAIPNSPAGTGFTLASYDIGSNGSLSYQVGTGPAATTTTLTANPATSAQQGSSVTLTGTVSPASAAGTVAFEENGTVVGTQAVSSGVAALTTSKLLASPPGGASLTATFTPTNPSSFTSSTSAALTYTVNPVAAKPTLTGPHQVGQKETCNESLEPGVTATYAWKVGSTQVGTGKTLTVPASAVNKQLACTATVQDGSGPKSSATSSSVKVSLGKALTAVKKPSLSGSHKVGKTETVKPGTWSQKATFTYQWLLNGKVIKHATKSTFKPTKSDKGKKLSCRVTAHKAGFANGSATTSSVKVSS